MNGPIDFQRYRGRESGWFKGEIIEMAQLTEGNFATVEKWLADNGSEGHPWTNESYVVGLWVTGTWHDGNTKTPMPFGWWVYKTEYGKVGIAAEVSLENHYAPA